MMKNLVISCILALANQGFALELAPLFKDGAVLQRDKPLPVWGKAATGAEVSVTFGKETRSTKTKADGTWLIELSALPANVEGQTLTITEAGQPPQQVKNVVVGEVWLASGQSNMAWTIARSRQADRDLAAQGPVPNLRIFQVTKSLNEQRQFHAQGNWSDATPENVQLFSAVGYFFGRRLANELKIPIGIIHSSWGGSKIEPWWAEEGLTGIESLAEQRKHRLSLTPEFPEYRETYRRYVDDVAAWAKDTAAALDAGKNAAPLPATPLMKMGIGKEVGLYQAMIHPLVPYSLRGFIWYQGESNLGDGMIYADKMRALAEGWRTQFRAPQAPLLYTQLATYRKGNTSDFSLPSMWWAQQSALKIPHTGMAVTNDIGDPKDIHPTNKFDVGERLARWALADSYGKDLVKSGPLFQSAKVEGDAIRVRFDHTGSGLASRDQAPLSLFEIGGADGIFHAAEATVSDDDKTLLVRSAQVLQPDRVRFAWSQAAQPNLMNKEGLPAGAFNTTWPSDQPLPR
jgi:sialate O-acetylesterase